MAELSPKSSPKLSIEEIKKVARLANLKISDGEVQRMAANLTDILGHIEQLNRIDTSDVEPTSHVLQVENVFREDAVAQPFEEGRSLDNAPAKDKGYFSVPRVIE